MVQKLFTAKVFAAPLERLDVVLRQHLRERLIRNRVKSSADAVYRADVHVRELSDCGLQYCNLPPSLGSLVF